MSQINVNDPPPTTYDTSGDRSAAAGINLITVLIVLAVLAVLAWFLFTGPLRGIGSTTSPSTTVNNNPPAQTQPSNNINVNPPNVNVNPPASGSNSGSNGGTSGGASGGTNTGGSTTGGTNR